jgi:hypothetical protein
MLRPARERRAAAAWLSVSLGLLGPALDVHAQSDAGTVFSGSLRLDYFSSSRDLDDVRHVIGASTEIKLLHSFSRDEQVNLEARLSREDLSRDTRDHSRLINAYWQARGERIDARIGQQKIRWGKTDGINPTDFFTPIDNTVLLPLESDRYLSVLAVRVDVHIDSTSNLSLVAEPGFTPSRLPRSIAVPVSAIEERPSGRRPPQTGIRLSHVGENFDWSLSAFHGFSTLPVLSFIGAAADGSPQYLRYYPESDGLGADMARNFGKWGFRAELAYTRLHAENGRQPVAPNYFLVSGFDRSIYDWSFNVQLLLRYTPGYGTTNAFENPQQQLAAVQNAIVYNQQKRLATGMTARVAANWLHETLQTEVLAIGYFDPTNYLIRPLLTYALSDRRKLLFGGEYYAGDDLSFFGSLKRNRTLFVEFQQFF